MKLSYVTTYDARDVHNWSGVPHHVARSLEDLGIPMEYIGNLKLKNARLLKLKRLLYRKFGKTYLVDRNISVVNSYARQIAGRLGRDTDCVFSVSSIPISALDTNKPKVFYTDATFAGMVGFYEAFSDLCAETIKIGNEIEQTALSSCSLAIYSSEWAADTAIASYDVDPGKVKVVPFGANIRCPRSQADIKAIIGNRSRTTCKLLFLGVDWDRKGGDITLEIAQNLQDAGIDTELHIAGIRELPVADLPKYATNHGFISKSSAQGASKLEELMAESHFLILPTKAEAYGLVFCEASSFGVPSVATDVGGIPTIIKNDVNGRLFPLATTADIYACYIRDIFLDQDRYRDLALSSYNEFESRLNWKVSSGKIVKLLNEI